MAKQGFSEEDVKRMKRAKAEPITAMEKGRIIWEIDVESPSMPPEVGHKYEPDDVFCYIATPWNTYDRVLANLVDASLRYVPSKVLWSIKVMLWLM